MIRNKSDAKYKLYDKAYSNILERYNSHSNQDAKPLIKKLILYGIKMINIQKECEIATYEQVKYTFKIADHIKTCMSLLNPSEFINIFPITKDFDGHKYKCKDYFYTRDYVNKLDQAKPIGKEIDNFLWEYTNQEIGMFNVRLMGYVSDLKKFQCKPLLMQVWNDIMGLKTYTPTSPAKDTTQSLLPI